jgi:hypothetical protein
MCVVMYLYGTDGLVDMQAICTTFMSMISDVK